MADTWIEVSVDCPCPICSRPDWCRISPDGQVVACRRENRGGETKSYSDGTTAHIHRITSPSANGRHQSSAAKSAPRKAIETADAATRDRAYRLLLDNLTLSQEHRDNLRRRGLIDWQIDSRGYRTWTHDSLVTLKIFSELGDAVFRTVPGFGPEIRIHAAPGILIPCRTISGQIIALKIRRDAAGKKHGRYSYLSSNWQRHQGPGPGSPCHVPLGIEGPVERVRITEGELKADVATCLSDAPTISFPGAQSWRKAYDTARALGSRTIVVAFDADSATNKMVAECQLHCVQAIVTDGLQVELETWYQAAGKGIDDLLAAGRRPEIWRGRDALAKAKTIAEISARSAKPNEAVDDPHRLARVNLEQYASRRSGRTLRYWRDEWFVWRQTHYRRISEKELRAKIAEACKQEFDKAHLSGQDDQEYVRKVTVSLVTNVLQATAGRVQISPTTEPMTWLPTGERKNYVAMKNGILDMDAVIRDQGNYLLPHSADWFSTVCLPYKFDPEAKCPRWEAFLERNMEMDPERIKILQEWAGYLLLPDTGQQKFLVCEGEGANGKSVYCAAIEAMLGGAANVSHVALESFGEKFELTSTLDKLANICGDAGELDKVAEGHIKSFTSGNPMTFGRKYLDSVERTPTARLMLACNNRPRFSDRSDGVWRRMLLVPWEIQIPQEDRIPNMDKPWWWERSGELPGILLWAILGLHRLNQQGYFTPSEKCQAALDDYRSEMSPARTFLQEHIEASQTSKIRASLLYDFYSKWARASGHHPLADRQFGREIFRLFRKCKRVKCGTRQSRFWAYEGISFSCDEICGEKTDDAILF